MKIKIIAPDNMAPEAALNLARVRLWSAAPIQREYHTEYHWYDESLWAVAVKQTADPIKFTVRITLSLKGSEKVHTTTGVTVPMPLPPPERRGHV
jgi:hypothetical protein